jgi:hypothetical protein
LNQESDQVHRHKGYIQRSLKELPLAYRHLALLDNYLQSNVIFIPDGVFSAVMTYFVYYLLIVAGSCLSTIGLLLWNAHDFETFGILMHDGWKIHPVHILVLGVAMTVPAIWEIFQLINGKSPRND